MARQPPRAPRVWAASVLLLATGAVAATLPAPRPLTDDDRTQLSTLALRQHAVQWNAKATRAELVAAVADMHPALVAEASAQVRDMLASDDKTYRRHRRLARKLFPCVRTAADLRRVPDAEVFASTSEFGVAPFSAPWGVETQVVAIAAEGDELAHVLLRSRWGEPLDLQGAPTPAPRPWELGVTPMTFARTDAGWKRVATDPSGSVSYALAYGWKAKQLSAGAVSTWCPPSSTP
jgi:hypothetical protein